MEVARIRKRCAREEGGKGEGAIKNMGKCGRRKGRQGVGEIR